jgi:Ca-activated chloride channel family protein
VSFASPLRLLLLAAPIGLVAGYILMQHRRKSVAVRFTSVDLLASVAPRRAGWQRHMAPALLLTTLVLLTVGFAQPLHTVRTPRQQATVILAMDVSGSMVADDVAPDRLTAAKEAADSFVGNLPSGVMLGLVSFSTNAHIVVPPTADRAVVRNAVDALRAGGGTATGNAIQLSLEAARSIDATTQAKKSPTAIVLMSDGKPTQIGGIGAAEQAVNEAVAAAKSANVKINTIAFGTPDGTVTIQGETIPVPSDPEAMARIASSTGGRTFTATSARELKSVYGDIGRTVGYVKHRKEMTAVFTGLGLLLGAAAAGAALTWGHRIA